jgi:hypothetical protein
MLWLDPCHTSNAHRFGDYQARDRNAGNQVEANVFPVVVRQPRQNWEETPDLTSGTLFLSGGHILTTIIIGIIAVIIEIIALFNPVSVSTVIDLGASVLIIFGLKLIVSGFFARRV